jgi:hypothetical protein
VVLDSFHTCFTLANIIACLGHVSSRRTKNALSSRISNHNQKQKYNCIDVENILKCPSSSDILGYLLAVPKESDDPDQFVKECLKVGLKHRQLVEVRKQVISAHSSLEGLDQSIGAALS